MPSLPYYHLTGKARLDKAINTLLGIIEGVSIDSHINDQERSFLLQWLLEHEEYRDQHPFNELLPIIAEAINDNVLEEDEKEDISNFCWKFKSGQYYDAITGDIQRLEAILGGIAADDLINEQELRGLLEWLADHDHLKTCWPYDEVDSLVTHILADGLIDEREHRALKAFFNEFTALYDNHTLVQPEYLEEQTLTGLCAACPDIRFSGSLFCFTGVSSRHTRSVLEKMVHTRGGSTARNVTQNLNYLVIGADGNPCWAYACYGRKVEKAVEYRKQQHRIVIVHENDFHDAIANTPES